MSCLGGLRSQLQRVHQNTNSWWRQYFARTQVSHKYLKRPALGSPGSYLAKTYDTLDASESRATPSNKILFLSNWAR